MSLKSWLDVSRSLNRELETVEIADQHCRSALTYDLAVRHTPTTDTAPVDLFNFTIRLVCSSIDKLHSTIRAVGAL